MWRRIGLSLGPMTQRPAQGIKRAMAKAGITKPQRCKTNKPNVMKPPFFQVALPM
jgi:hypothetical protein